MSSTTLRPALRLLSQPSLSRTYAAKASSSSSSSQNPTLHVPTDSRSEILRSVLYPQDSYSPTSSSPTGTYHHDYLNRLQTVIPSLEVHETIERAYQAYQRQLRLQRQSALEAKFNAMVEACNELEQITNPLNGGVEAQEGKGGMYHRQVYELATAEIKQSQRKNEDKPTKGGKKTVEQRWKETRIEGLVPREQWIPTETRGKGWEYDWTRPGH